MKKPELFIKINYNEIHILPQFEWVNGTNVGFRASITILIFTIQFDYDK